MYYYELTTTFGCQLLFSTTPSLCSKTNLHLLFFITRNIQSFSIWKLVEQITQRTKLEHLTAPKILFKIDLFQ